jgi:hypothetical protein
LAGKRHSNKLCRWRPNLQPKNVITAVAVILVAAVEGVEAILEAAEAEVAVEPLQPAQVHLDHEP